MANSVAPDGLTFEPNAESLAALKRLFTNFDGDMRKKIAGPAFRKAGKIVLEDAQSHAPRRTGNLAASLAEKVLTEARDGNVGVRIYSRRSGKFPHGFLAHLIEYGSRVVVVRGIAKGGGLIKQQVGHQPARAFIRPALTKNVAKIMQVVGEEINKGIARDYKRNAKNAGG